MVQTLVTHRLFDGKEFHQNVAVTFDKGEITQISPSQAKPDYLLLVPGFIDIQVNGGGGLLFNQQPDIVCLQTMINGHKQFGTTAMLPTLITDNLSTMKVAAAAIAEAVALEMPGIIGVHFEGPHLSVPKRGIHPEQQIRPFSDKELALFTRQDLGHVVVTLAPENVSPDIIRDLVRQGVKVCLGHSNADANTVLCALDAGASGFTHLYNAMSGLSGRNPGMLGAALFRDDAYCGLIVDGFHVDALSCQFAHKIKGRDKLLLVTDAMAHVGSNLQDMDYLDSRIIRQGNKLTLPDGTLAGSALDMLSAINNSRALGIADADALTMATSTPAHYLGCEALGHLRPGAAASMVALSARWQIQQVWIQGRPQLHLDSSQLQQA